MSLKIRCVPFLALVCTMPTSGIAETAENEEFVAKGLRVTELAQKLSELAWRPICIEEARWFPRKGEEADVLEHLKWRREVRIDLPIRGESFEAFRESFQNVYDEYWFSQVEGTVCIYPKKMAPLDFIVPDVKLKRVTLEEVLGKKDPLSLRDHGIFVDVKGISTALRRTPIHLHTQGTEARKAFEWIRRQLGQDLRWEVEE